MPTEAKNSDLPHKAVLLVHSGKVDDFGVPTTDAPEEIDSRWELGQQTTQQALATTELEVATVFVDRPVAVNSLLWRGTLAEYNAANPISNVYKVKQYSRIDDLKGLLTEHRVLVGSNHDNIPV